MEKILIGYYLINYLRIKYILLKKISQKLIYCKKKLGFLLIYFFLLIDIDPLFSKCNYDFCSETKNSSNKESELSLKIKEKNFYKKR